MSTIAATNLKNASSGTNNVVLNTDGTTTITAPSNIIKSATAQASTSGTAIDFTGIPSWVKRIVILFNGVSLNGSDRILIQIGDSGGLETTGYTSGCTGGNTSTTGYVCGDNVASSLHSGTFEIINISGNIWVGAGNLTTSAGVGITGTGTKTLSGVLDRVTITRTGTNTFDAGSINILYEG